MYISSPLKESKMAVTLDNISRLAYVARVVSVGLVRKIGQERYTEPNLGITIMKAPKRNAYSVKHLL